MRYLLPITILLAFFSSCNVENGEKWQKINEEESEILCGGYTAQRDVTAEELEIFRSAAGDSLAGFTPVSVATQVVAGLNYRFICDSPAGSKTVTVYRNLEGRLSITDIQ